MSGKVILEVKGEPVVEWPADDFKHATILAISDYVETLRNILTAAVSGDVPVNTARHQYQMALIATAKFLRRVDVVFPVDDAPHHFMNLAAIINDVDEGVAHPVITPPKQSGHKDRTDQWLVRAQVAAGLTMLMELGLGKKAAIAYKIAKKYPDLKNALRAESSKLQDSISNWHAVFRDAVASYEKGELPELTPPQAGFRGALNDFKRLQHTLDNKALETMAWSEIACGAKLAKRLPGPKKSIPPG